MTYRPIFQQEILVQGFETVSTTAKQTLGSRYKGKDDVTGQVAEFTYVKFAGVTELGKAMRFEDKDNLAYSLSATGSGKVGLAMTTAAANDYGWLLVYGAGNVLAASAAAGAPVLTTGTAGTVTDQAGGDTLTDIHFTGAVVSGKAPVDLNYPKVL